MQIVWFRQDLRLADQPALAAAAAAGPVLPVYVEDGESPGLRAMGGASRWWLARSLASLDQSLRARGGRLLVCEGASAEVLQRLAEETGAEAIHATAVSEPWWAGIEARLGKRLKLHGHPTLHEPGAVVTKDGARYRVFTPFARAHRALGAPPAPRPAPEDIRFAELPAEPSALPRFSPRWARGFVGTPGEAGAQAALSAFLPKLEAYGSRRDFPSEAATSRLSPHLHFGEISPNQVWHAAEAAAGAAAEPFTRQLIWRDFAHDLIRAFPDSHAKAHRPEFDRMAWTDVTRAPGRDWLEAWQQGRTGYPLVDAGMRQLWRSGWMHNRVRMVVASFLTKHLGIDWREGERWFWDTLVDADLMNNAMGWQWVMGSGVDSQPYFRIFTPVGQAEKFDAMAYIRCWAPEYASAEPVNPIVD
ncbi:MAG: deoxyribodipyrimidine photo-lyase, partial [Sphingomonadaceae bacterium]